MKIIIRAFLQYYSHFLLYTLDLICLCFIRAVLEVCKVYG